MKYFYVGKYKTNKTLKNIYYEKGLDKFYVLDQSFENKDDGLEILYDCLPQNYEDEEMKPFEITNKYEKLALKVLYHYKKRKQKEKRKEEEDLRKFRERAIKNGKGRIKALFVALMLLQTYIFCLMKDIHPTIYLKNKIIDHTTDTENQHEIYDKFGEAITCNNTISPKLRTVLFNDFNLLAFSDTPMIDLKVSEIASRLKTYDFTYLNETNYIDALAYIISGDLNGVSRGVAYSLDERANKREASDESLLFNAISIGYKDNILEDLFIYGTHGYNSKLAKIYDIDKGEIKELTKMLNNFYESNDAQEKEDIKNSIYTKLGNILTIYYKNKEKINELDKCILASQIYGGSFTVSNNIFGEDIVVTRTDNDYGNFKKYYIRESGIDESISVYQRKLAELIKSKGTNLDYDDPDCRFLVYLYTFCYDDTLSYYNKGLLTSKTPESMAYMIINNVFDDKGYTNVKPEFLYAYLTSGDVNKDVLLREIVTVNDDAYNVALYVEYLRCLSKEVDMNFATGSSSRILKSLEYDNKELYDMLVKALENDESLFSEFSIMPNSHEYSNDEIKKYVVEQKYRYNNQK